MDFAQQALGPLLKSWRKRLGLSQPDAAVILGCAVITLQCWEQGVAEPRFDRALRIAMEAVAMEAGRLELGEAHNLTDLATKVLTR
jgi:transcriptional regulator with XRE-family HTH domain